ncbi:hypothetical protein CPB83DRAFT_901860 [Crepidotus variabilis]|uniref:Hydrophobin n=1 Tax=Crepidotus variabilis TaxID=179855 RepID=A0A9P6JWR3_9AGAR|nr:hypothetical protein CPB83DRAFT_901860 [Crepidotus variabilis]
MMFIKAVTLLALPFLAAAVALEKRGYGYGGACNSGNVSCCNQYHASNSPVAQHYAGLLGIDAETAKDFSVAAQCNPITGIGAAQTGCEQQTLCCDNNNVNNVLVNFSCSPITVA